MTIEYMNAVSVHAVSKTLRGRQVLNQIDLDVPVAQIVGITGPNGSGKSMLLRVLCGLVLPDAGTVRVMGKQIGRDTEFPPALGALIDGPGFIMDYAGSNNLELLASIRNCISKNEIHRVMQRVGLDPKDPRPVKAYSTGMRQRLGLAQAIMENPRLLLLDEPTNALDRNGIQEIHHLALELRAQGVTIVLTSHQRQEIQTLCDSAYLMEQGRLSPCDIRAL